MNPAGTFSILLVEDENSIAVDFQHSLCKYGYTVQIARTGEEAVQLFNHPNEIDLILNGILILVKGIDGPEAATQILMIKEIPIVFLSSHAELDKVQRTEAINSYGYVVKESGITVLNTSIKLAIRLFKAREKEKQKSEEKYREIIMQSRDGIVITIPRRALSQIGTRALSN